MKMIEYLSVLFGDVSFFGTGLVIAIVGLIIGLARLFTNNYKMGIVTGSMFCLIVALMFKSYVYSGLLTAFGLVLITTAFIPIYHEIKDSLPSLIMLALVINLCFLAVNFSWLNDTYAMNEYYDAEDKVINNIGRAVKGYNSDEKGDSLTKTEEAEVIIKQQLDESAFQPKETILEIGKFLWMFGKFVGAVFLLPFRLGMVFITGGIPAIFMTIYISLLNALLMMKVIIFVMKKGEE